MRVRTKLNSWVVAMAAVCLLAPASGVRAETNVLDNPILVLLPAVKNMPAPAWVKPGLRMAYHYGSVSHGGKVTTTGEGFQEMDVVAPVGPWVPGAVSLYVTDGTTINPNGCYYCLYTPGAGAYWVNPTALQNPGALHHGQGFTIATGPYTLDGVTYDALRVQYKDKTSVSVWTFDRKLGMLLFESYHSSSIDTLMTMAQVRQMKVPWQLTAAPACAARAQLSYQGTWTMYIPDTTPYQLPMTLAAARAGGTNSCTQYNVTQTVQGLDPTPSTNLTGVAQMQGGYWMTPKALASLKAGQVLDQDPITKIKLWVQKISTTPRKTVYLAQSGQGCTTTTAFDYQTGTGVYVKVSVLVGWVTYVTELSLVGSPTGSPVAQGQPPALALTATAAPAKGGTTQITVNLSHAATAQVTILNLAGRVVAALPEKELLAGMSTLLWDEKSADGTQVPAGRYLVRVTARTQDGSQAQALAGLSLGR